MLKILYFSTGIIIFHMFDMWISVLMWTFALGVVVERELNPRSPLSVTSSDGKQK